MLDGGTLLSAVQAREVEGKPPLAAVTDFNSQFLFGNKLVNDFPWKVVLRVSEHQSVGVIAGEGKCDGGRVLRNVGHVEYAAVTRYELKLFETFALAAVPVFGAAGSAI